MESKLDRASHSKKASPGAMYFLQAVPIKFAILRCLMPSDLQPARRAVYMNGEQKRRYRKRGIMTRGGAQTSRFELHWSDNVRFRRRFDRSAQLQLSNRTIPAG